MKKPLWMSLKGETRRLYDALVVLSVARKLLDKRTVKWTKDRWVYGKHKNGSVIPTSSEYCAVEVGQRAVEDGGFGNCSACAIGVVNVAAGVVSWCRAGAPPFAGEDFPFAGGAPAAEINGVLLRIISREYLTVSAFNDDKKTKLPSVLDLFDRGIQKLQADLNRTLKAR